MKPFLLDLLVCPKCNAGLETSSADTLVCKKCSSSFPIVEGKPIFSPVPSTINPSEKRDRSADSGTRWRQANWKFIKEQVTDLLPDTKILDVGAGRGDFSHLFNNLKYLAVDVYPYPEIDLVCDLCQCVPFQKDVFNRVAILNVCEHIYDPRLLLSSVYKILVPGGKAIITIPFLLKIHQAPFDFSRYTHFALQKMGTDAGFEIEKIEGFYDPAGLLGESARYYRFWEIPKLNRFQRLIAHFSLTFIEFQVFLLEGLSGKGRVEDPDQYDFPAPSGYHLVFRKPMGRSSR